MAATETPTKRPLTGPSVADMAASIRRLSGGTTTAVRFVGGMFVFAAKAFAYIPLVLRKYRAEVRRQIGQVTLGTGLFITFTGTLGVIIAQSLAIGVNVAIEGFQGLNQLGLAPFMGFVSAYANTRELAPIIAAVAIAAQIGCKFTAQIGAQRIGEEIDALEVMGIPSVPYVVTTRIIAVITTMIPLYLIGLIFSYLGTKLTVVYLYRQAEGTYDHYFRLFLEPIDVLYSVVKVIVFALAIVIVHTYYGFNATGGPAGVGIATARAIRASTVIIASTNVLMTMLFWGLHGVTLSGG